jgi:peptidoglycan/LPS O-acetylase OafA/YrhL
VSANAGGSPRFPSLDGWRAVSIAIVLAGHAQHTFNFPPALYPPFGWLFDGDLGVRAFFVISGFLITWLLVIEYDRRGRIHLGHFFARRALRILPPYGALLLTLAGLQWIGFYTQPTATWIANLTFTTNFIHTAWPTAHLWSLGVEEQFYIIWPALLVLATAAATLRRGLLLLLVPLALAPICRVVTYLALYPHAAARAFSEYSFLNYCDALAMGCVLAIVLARRGDLVRHALQSRMLLTTMTAAALIAVPYVLAKLQLIGVLTVPFGQTLEACGMALLLVQSVLFPDWAMFRPLNWAWVGQIGVLSYSLYLWQQVWSSLPHSFGIGPTWLMSFQWWLIPTFASAVLSHLAFERPFLKYRARFRAV